MLVFPTFRYLEARLDPDAQTMFSVRASLGDEPGTAYKKAISDYVIALKAIPGHWDNITQLIVFAGATTVSGGLVPIKGLTPTHSNLTAGAFDLKSGVKGNGTNISIDTGYLGTAFPQNDCHQYVYVTEAGTTARTIYGHGGTASGSSRLNWVSLIANRGASAISHTEAGLGGYGSSRSGGASFSRMLANTVGTVTQSSVAPNGGRFFLLARGQTNNTVDNWSSNRILVWALGTATTMADYNAPTADLVASLNAI